LISFNITNYPLTKIYKLFPLMLACRRGPYSELDEQCEGEDGFDEAPYVLEGSGLTTAPVDGMGSRTRGMRTRVEYKFMKPQ
jgi:hypothetical protein